MEGTLTSPVYMNCLDPGHAALFANTFPVMALSPDANCVNGEAQRQESKSGGGQDRV